MVIRGDARHIPLRDGVVQAVVTSPPYWGLRRYPVAPLVWGGDPECAHKWGVMERGRRKDVLPAGASAAGRLGVREEQTGLNEGGRFCRRCDAWLGQLGLEPGPRSYVAHLVEVMREVRRVLRPDGTVWLVLGDTFAGYHGNSRVDEDDAPSNKPGYVGNMHASSVGLDGLKAKDLAGIPWRAALALQRDGWYLRSDIVWAKTNCLPEPVLDRPTRSHEYVFLLAKSERYFYDGAAIAEPATREASGNRDRFVAAAGERTRLNTHFGSSIPWINTTGQRARRDVWQVRPGAVAGHYAAFPAELAALCIQAGTSAAGSCAACGTPWVRELRKCAVGRARERGNGGLGSAARREPQGLDPVTGDFREGVVYQTVGWTPGCGCGAAPVPCLVLDPFLGSGTVGLAAEGLGRRWIGVELAEEYAELARRRTAQMGLGLMASAGGTRRAPGIPAEGGGDNGRAA